MPCQEGDPCYEWVGAELRKLPLWGIVEPNFEWPTPEAYALMGPDVSVTSIDFKTYASNAN